MKKVLVILIITVLITTSIAHIRVNATESEDYGWVLVEVVDIDNKKAFEDYNEGYKDIYNIEGSYGRNNFSIKWTYVGKSDSNSEPNKVNGESITFDASFSQPPEQIKPDSEISINFSLSSGGNSLSYFSPSASARGQIGKNSSGWGYFISSDQKTSFKTDINNNYDTFNEEISATSPQGKEGDTLELRFHLYSTQKLETRYLYEYKKIDETPTEIEEYKPSETEDVSSDQTKSDEEDSSEESDSESSPYKTPKTPEGKYIDSGVRISDMYGEVLVRRGDDLLGWDAVEIDTIIYAGDHIKTSYDSRVVLSLSDMTTFHIEEESHIVMDTMSEKENKLALLAGKIISNVKKMIKDGSMNIEMSQAVAGIKGTTFMLEEDGNTSTLKVFEGTIEFTPYGEEAIIVTDEETVSIADGIPSQVEKFSISKELSSLEKDTQEEYIKILGEKGITFEDTDSNIEENTVVESEDTTNKNDSETDGNEEVDYNFEEKIDEYEKHVERQSILKYLVGAVVIGGAIGVLFLVNKRK